MRVALTFALSLLSAHLHVASRPASTPPRTMSVLSVSIAGLRSNRGLLRVSLYEGPKGFPSDPGAARQAIELPLPLTSSTIELPALPNGRYAIAVHHDENGNHRMDSGMFGIPKEGWGTSNDPRPKLRPPRFEEAAIVLDGDRALTVRLTY